ncbi:lipid IV(A) 3-deoxy-D-manno-octulosonic acid transferase [Algiphilus sp.]|uniref:lipid IV(A) 3-deoxy-D-manno-octulosonic acid transferase n=1 Tax=Algiphilus sp. TaxID=1872431 RepID=UPI003BAD7D66
MLRLLYRILLNLGVWPATLLLTLRARRQGDAAGRWPERLGWVRRMERPIAVWVHAASLGEVVAARPLIDALVARHGEGSIWITTMTTSGSQAVRDIWGQRVRHSYVPFDLPGMVRRFLHRVQPQVCLVLETELWPHLFAVLAQRRIPLFIANARLSPRSLRGYDRIRGSIAKVLQQVTLVATQSEADALRFRSLGAPNVVCAGNIKFDLTPPVAALQRGRQWREALGSRPVWIAASTHDGEEAAVLAAHRDLLRWYPDARLVLVPRHPQRFEAVARALDRDGWRYARRSGFSDAAEIPSDTPLLLGDSTGEMFAYLAMADVAFIGGSLVEVGGHNLLEPASIGLPVLFGPHMFHFVDARRLLVDAGGAQEVASAQDLAVDIAALFAEPDTRATMGQAAAEAVAANRGAVARHLALLDEVRATWPPTVG